MRLISQQPDPENFKQDVDYEQNLLIFSLKKALPATVHLKKT